MKNFLYTKTGAPEALEMNFKQVSEMITELLREHRAKLQQELTTWNRMATEKWVDADMHLFIWASEKAKVGEYVNWRFGTFTRLRDKIE